MEIAFGATTYNFIARYYAAIKVREAPCECFLGGMHRCHGFRRIWGRITVIECRDYTVLTLGDIFQPPFDREAKLFLRHLLAGIYVIDVLEICASACALIFVYASCFADKMVRNFIVFDSYPSELRCKMRDVHFRNCYVACDQIEHVIKYAKADRIILGERATVECDCVDVYACASCVGDMLDDKGMDMVTLTRSVLLTTLRDKCLYFVRMNWRDATDVRIFDGSNTAIDNDCLLRNIMTKHHFAGVATRSAINATIPRKRDNWHNANKLQSCCEDYCDDYCEDYETPQKESNKRDKHSRKYKIKG